MNEERGSQEEFEDKDERGIHLDDELPDITPFQHLLQDVYLQIINKRKRPRMNDREFAKYLGIHPATLSHWLAHGDRTPSYESAVKLSQIPEIGERIFSILRYDAPGLSRDRDPESMFIVDNLTNLPRAVKIRIFKIIKEYLYGTDIKDSSDGGGEKPE